MLQNLPGPKRLPSRRAETIILKVARTKDPIPVRSSKLFSRWCGNMWALSILRSLINSPLELTSTPFL